MTDKTFLELKEDSVWPKQDARERVLVVALNIPGYYSLPIRLLSLLAEATPDIAAAYDVRYFEAENNSAPASLKKLILAWKPSIVGFSVNIWNRTLTLKLIQSLKAASRETAIMLGGQEVSHAVDNCMELCPEVDYIIDGEGELPFLEFLRAWQPDKKRLSDPNAVSGLHYRVNGGVSFTREANCIESLDEVPSAALSGLIPIGEKNKLGVMVEGARGCPYKCSFCFEGGKAKKVRTASLEKIEAEITHMAEKGAAYFHILDPILSNSKPERLRAVSEVFRKVRQKAPVLVSVESYAQHITEEIAGYLSQFSIIDIGLQSTNPETQQAIRRHYEIERFVSGIEELRKSGATFNIYLICGLPHETLITYLEGIKFVGGQRPTRLFLNELLLLNGTELRKRAEEYGYDFKPEPPYSVHSSEWMSRYDMRFAHVASKEIERRYNLSMPSVYPHAPWTRRTVRKQEAPLTLDLALECTLEKAGPCTGCQRAAGAWKPTDSAMAEAINAADGREVWLSGGDSLDDKRVYQLLGQLKLAGAYRVGLSAPVMAFRDPMALELLATNGVWFYRTFIKVSQVLKSESEEFIALGNLKKSYPLKGYTVISPLVHVCLLPEAETTPESYGAALEALGELGPTFTPCVPEAISSRGKDWLGAVRAAFNVAIERGTWILMSPGMALGAFKRVTDPEGTVGLLKELQVVARVEKTPPCYIGAGQKTDKGA